MIGGMFDATQKRRQSSTSTVSIGQHLGQADRTMFIIQQHQANRWTCLGSGMLHSKFVRMLKPMCPEAASMVARVAPAFC